MDLASMAAGILASQAGALQQQVATAALKQNLNSQKSAVLAVLDAGKQNLSLANIGAGIGGNLNIAA
jgi:hypothetical protein